MTVMGRAVDRGFDAVSAYWHTPAPAERLAVLRILTGLFAFVYVTVRVAYFASYEKLSPHQFKPIGIVSLIDAPLSPWLTWSIAIVAVVTGAAFTAGFHYRIAAPLFGASLLWVLSYRSSWGMIFHTENLLCLHVLALSLAPAAADVYAFDAAPERSEPDVHGRYGWPIRLLCGITVLAYVVAGVSKLRNSGWGWFTSDLLQNYIAYDAIRKIELGSLHSPVGGYLSEHHPAIFKPLAAASLGLELAAPIAMFSRRFATAWVVGIVGFHLGVLALMAIFFPYPVLLIAFASFFPVERLAARILAWRRRYAELPG